MGQVFFTSDLHIGHRYVAGLRYEAFVGRGALEEDFSPRTVSDEVVAWHDNLLAQEWDKTVNPSGDRGDQVWVLGDISAGGSKSQMKALAWLMQRPGTKHLIIGNHDGVHPMHRDSHKWQRRYLGAFDSVQLAARRKMAGKYVLLSHFPYQGSEFGDHTEEERFTQWRLPDMDLHLLHGHTHTADRRHDKEIHVGVDAWDFAPVPRETIEEMIQEV